MPADTRLWHPFADMHAVRGNELVIARGDGAVVWDEDGKEYIDGTASLWNVNVGHGRTEIVDAGGASQPDCPGMVTSLVGFGAPGPDDRDWRHHG